MLLRRSILATPAVNERMFEKAAMCGADMVFLDLEDSVPQAMKDAARSTAVEGLTGCDWGRVVRAVRINGLKTQWAYDDVVSVVTGASNAIDALVLPKVSAAREVWFVETLLNQLEAKLGLDKRIRLDVGIEDVEGLINVEEIAKSSDRISALIFGSGDFAISQKARVDRNLEPADSYPGDIWHYARSKILLAARLVGLEAIDTVYPNYNDNEGLERSARNAAVLGYNGKLLIHPIQVPIANEVFTPTEDEVAHARKNVEAYYDGERRGQGAVGVDGTMIDAVHVRLARDVIARSALTDRSNDK